MGVVTSAMVHLGPKVRFTGRASKVEGKLSCSLRVQGLSGSDLYLFFDELSALDRMIDNLEQLWKLLANEREGEVHDGRTAVRPA